MFFFGLGYCARRAHSARALDRGERNGADGGSRRRLCVARASRPIASTGPRRTPALEPALEKAEAIVVSIPPRDGAGRGARAIRLRDRRRARDAPAHRLLFDHRRLWRPWRRLGRRDERDADAHGARARAARGRGALDGGGQGARASTRTSCVSPASTGPAATRSSICARARRGASSSRARCSTAPMSTTSPRSPRLVLTRGLRGRGLERRRRGTRPAAGRHRLCGGAARRARRRPRSRSTRRGAVADGARASTTTTSASRSPGLRRELGFAPAYPTYREGLRALAEAGEGRGA